MTTFTATDRQGHIVAVKQLADGRLVFVWDEGYLEKREIITVQK